MSWAITVIAILLNCGLAKGQERLVLFGGNELVNVGLLQFFQWAKPQNQSAGKVLIITWNAKAPEAVFTGEKTYFIDVLVKAGHLASQIPFFEKAALRDSLLSEDKETASHAKSSFLEALAEATAVFFSGGDQSFTLDVMNRHPEIESALKTKYQLGTVFSGTSAGTALMSNPMLWAPDGKPQDYKTMRGLGLLPTNIIIDQHFFARELRLKRLKAAVLEHHRPYGLGVDEDGAVLITEGKHVTVLGEQNAMLLVNSRNNSAGQIQEILLKPGDRYEMVTH